MLFSALGIHQDGQLLITIDPWEERRARELMQEELMLRLYNHVYADPVYWNNLGVEDRIFQLTSAIAVVEPDAVFCGSTAARSMASARLIRFWIKSSAAATVYKA